MVARKEECVDGGRESRKEAFSQWERDCVAKHGWYAHFVTDDDPGSPTGFNCHTHGLSETLGCLDLQIVFPMDPTLAHQFMSMMIEELKRGTKIEPGQFYDCVLEGYNVTFGVASECGRQVHRMILPDKEGNLLESDLSGDFLTQWDGCEKI